MSTITYEFSLYSELKEREFVSTCAYGKEFSIMNHKGFWVIHETSGLAISPSRCVRRMLELEEKYINESLDDAPNEKTSQQIDKLCAEMFKKAIKRMTFPQLIELIELIKRCQKDLIVELIKKSIT